MLLLLLFLCSTTTALYFTTPPPPSLDVLEGQDVTLHCGVRTHLTNLGLVKFRWLYSPHLPATVLPAPLAYPNCDVTSTGSGDTSTLTINTVTATQTGFYQCEARAGVNVVYSSVSNVRVHYLHQTLPNQVRTKVIGHPLDSFLVELGECNTHGINSYPESKLLWKVTDSTGSAVTLTTSFTTPEDTQIQDLTAGKSQLRSQLSADSFIIYNLTPRHGELSYTCYASITFNGVVREVPVVTWGITGADTYNFVGASLDYNYMTNIVLETKSPVVEVGDSYDVACYCAGYQHPDSATSHVTDHVTITWFKEGVVLQEASEVIKLRNVSMADNGKYICEARVGDLVQSKPYWLTVIAKTEPAELHFVETPQHTWHVVAPATLVSDQVELSKRVGEQSTPRDHQIEISPICISSAGTPRWIRNGHRVDYPLKLPPIPRTYLTFQCVATDGESRLIEASVVVYLDQVSPVVMKLELLEGDQGYQGDQGDQGDQIRIACGGKAYPPPKVRLTITTLPELEDVSPVLHSETISGTYDVTKHVTLRKQRQVNITCSVRNEYYSQLDVLHLAYPNFTLPEPPTTAPSHVTHDVIVTTPNTTKPTKPGDTSNAKTDDLIEGQEEETSSDHETSDSTTFKKILIYVIGGVVGCLVLLIFTVCLVTSRVKRKHYQRLLRREKEQAITTSSSFAPYSKSPTPEDYYDVPAEFTVKKPPRKPADTPRDLALTRDLPRDLALTRDLPRDLHGTIHPEDDLEVYTDMRTFGSLKRSGGAQYTELDQGPRVHGVLVLPPPARSSPLIRTKYSEIAGTLPRADHLLVTSSPRADHVLVTSSPRDPIYENEDQVSRYSPKFKHSSTRTEFDRIEVETDVELELEVDVSSGHYELGDGSDDTDNDLRRI